MDVEDHAAGVESDGGIGVACSVVKKMGGSFGGGFSTLGLGRR